MSKQKERENLKGRNLENIAVYILLIVLNNSMTLPLWDFWEKEKEDYKTHHWLISGDEGLAFLAEVLTTNPL